MKKVGVIGAAGYTGGELIRLLIHHPQVSISFLQSNSNAGKKIATVHADLLGDTELEFDAAHHWDIDVLFFCAGHGEARKFVQANSIPEHIRLIDIGNDFRLSGDASIQDAGNHNRTFVYGLPELNKQQIINAQNIANPGCFATAIQLGLLPLANKGLLQDVYTTGITGSTGAGQSLSATSHFSWRTDNIQAYKTLTHQHLAEITESLSQSNADCVPTINFIPWRGDFARGIFTSSTVTCHLDLAEITAIYQQYYAGAAFTFVTTEPIYLKQVTNTNKAIIQLEKVGSKLVVHTAVDNLLKGASGQAIQNMNLLFGFPEKNGLNLKGNSF